MLPEDEAYERLCLQTLCEAEHLHFSQHFFKKRHNSAFIVNWHHELIADTIQEVIDGVTENVVINVAPGSSKTDLVVINLIARGLALNPRSRFLHLSYSDDLASLNSSTARDLVMSDEFQKMWPMKIADDAKAKKRWNILVDGKPAGGVYATSLGGQITGFRAGHMAPGFQGAIIIDDPLKPDDGYSPAKISAANRKLLTTVKSRKANPKTPIIVIMQRVAEHDVTGFIEDGNLTGQWKIVKIPALMDPATIEALGEKYKKKIDVTAQDDQGRVSYWPYKEPIEDLLSMERGEGKDQDGARVSRHVFATQYQQKPVALGGNMIRGQWFRRYTAATLPKIKYRNIYADTAQKTKERNDFSVFECWGMGVDGKIYILDLHRGKWEAPDLKRNAIAFWAKQKAVDADKFGHLRKLKVEDKSSGTGLIQSIKEDGKIPVDPIERTIDKVTRVMDAQPYIESGQVCIPEDEPWVLDFVKECEAFSADLSHDHDDQIDPMLDAVQDNLSTQNKMKTWARLAKG